jgi:hypothetical protein
MILKSRVNLPDCLVRLQAGGRVSFTRGEAMEAMEAVQLSDAAFLKAAVRLRREHMLLNLRRGIYVAAPPQFLSWGHRRRAGISTT